MAIDADPSPAAGALGTRGVRDLLEAEPVSPARPPGSFQLSASSLSGGTIPAAEAPSRRLWCALCACRVNVDAGPDAQDPPPLQLPVPFAPSSALHRKFASHSDAGAAAPGGAAISVASGGAASPAAPPRCWVVRTDSLTPFHAMPVVARPVVAGVEAAGEARAPPWVEEAARSLGLLPGAGASAPPAALEAWCAHSGVAVRPLFCRSRPTRPEFLGVSVVAAASPELRGCTLLLADACLTSKPEPLDAAPAEQTAEPLEPAAPALAAAACPPSSQPALGVARAGSTTAHPRKRERSPPSLTQPAVSGPKRSARPAQPRIRQLELRPAGQAPS